MKEHDPAFTREQIVKAREEKIEGTPQQQSRFDAMMEDAEEQVNLWSEYAGKYPIKRHRKIPKQIPKE